eukprot:TRINITY_DN1504_c0_g1_i19.p1 TRINITY_DN1504_c0_g1~~TRINITY_DN1504_c0_g1_i19.p1  ORF type:complete len:139 (-),score=26.52 TRINITY_DN1504_c0_g1_i19:332-748(-)
MLRESNGNVFEWLNSDIKYQEDSNFVTEALSLGTNYMSWKSIAFYYINKTKKHLREYFEGDRWKDEVILKKYLFVIQPLLSAAWLRHNRELPPRLLYDLLKAVHVPPEIKETIIVLIEKKRSNALSTGPPIKILGKPF